MNWKDETILIIWKDENWKWKSFESLILSLSIENENLYLLKIEWWIEWWISLSSKNENQLKDKIIEYIENT